MVVTQPGVKEPVGATRSVVPANPSRHSYAAPRKITCSNHALSFAMARPESHALRVFPDATAEELLRRLLEERPKFLLKSSLPMMLLLRIDVRPCDGNL